jgi:osmotically-inducible protein OsmY
LPDRHPDTDEGMTGPTIPDPDERIQHDVLQELKWDSHVQPNEVGVAVKDGIVSLTGWVDSYHKKAAAERAAQRVRGVQAVADGLEVRLPTSAERTDPDIAVAVRQALQWDAFVPAGKVDVTVSGGWVTLQGEVEWQHEKRAAEHTVRRLSIVRGVSNQIGVQSEYLPPPDELKLTIEDALIRNAETDAQRLQIDVDGDRVLLHGTVRAWAQKDEAERIAWSAPGVCTVENHIVVGPAAQPTR